MINLKTYNIKNLTLTTDLLSSYTSNFWNEIFLPIHNNKNKHLMLLCKVEYSNKEMGHRTIAHLRRVNFNDKDLFIRYLTARLGLLTEEYKDNEIISITFTYIEKEGLATERRLLSDFSDKTLTKHRFNNFNLPISMHPSDYGDIIASESKEHSIVFSVNDNGRGYKIEKTLDGLLSHVIILGPIDLKWTDTKIKGGFKREIGKSTIYFVDGEIVLRKQLLSAKPFRKGSIDNKLANNFITMDIETINKDNKLVPYLICAYNGKKYINSYSLNQEELFSIFIDQLLTLFTKSNKLVVYAHNLSGFDGIFLLKHLFKLGKVEPLLFHGRLISIKVKLNIVGYTDKTIIFKDSYLLLPLSLRRLCKAFNVESIKGYFPFKLTNIFYIGILPKIEYWTGIDTNIYNNLLSEYSKGWNFKNEAIKYCQLDCKCLFDILIKFNELIFSEFQVNIHKSLTLPALAMRIYKVNFMPKDTIYQILGKPEEAIRQSFN
jgi:hypothetical protein